MVMPKDQFLMKLKDLFLLLVAITGLWAFFSGYVGKSVALESQINRIAEINDEICTRYLPRIETNEKSILILQEQNKMIISYLEKIEKNMRR